MQGRSFQDANYQKYRWGFNGKERDNEIADEVHDFGERLQNSKIGRFFSPDRFKSKFPYQSPYIFAGNMPIVATDANGDSVYIVINARNVFRIDGKEATKYSQMIGRDLLLRTVSGKQLLTKYENSSTHDIYITIVEFNHSENADAAAFTTDERLIRRYGKSGYLNIKAAKTNGFSFDVNGSEDKGNYEDIMNLHGLKIRNIANVNQVIAIDKGFLGSSFYDAYEKAETLYHELKAHVDFRRIASSQLWRLMRTNPQSTITRGDIEHDSLYGGRAAGFDGFWSTEYKTKEAFKIMNQLLGLKRQNQDTKNKREQAEQVKRGRAGNE